MCFGLFPPHHRSLSLILGWNEIQPFSAVFQARLVIWNTMAPRDSRTQYLEYLLLWEIESHPRLHDLSSWVLMGGAGGEAGAVLTAKGDKTRPLLLAFLYSNIERLDGARGLILIWFHPYPIRLCVTVDAQSCFYQSNLLHYFCSLLFGSYQQQSPVRSAKI